MASGYIDYLKQLLQNGGLLGLAQFQGLISNLNLPGPLRDQIDAANAALVGYEICNLPCAAIAAGIVEAINVSNYLVDAFSGVPRTQKTILTGQRLMQSSVIPVQMLGQWWYKAGNANIVDSNAPDITHYFQPAFNYTIQTLNIPFAAPDWYALSYVIGEGQGASVFDQSYGAQHRATPMFVQQSAFEIQYPGERFPKELVQVYQLLANDFVTSKVPVNPVQPGNGGGGGGGGQGGGGQGGGSQLDQACCEQIVAALNNIAGLITANTDNLANAVDGRMDSLIAAIAPQVAAIAAAFSGLMQGLGAGTSSLVGALVNVTNAIDSTVINAAGEEVNAINAVSQAIVSALGKIDVDSENSLAGIAHAIQNIADCCKAIADRPYNTNGQLTALIRSAIQETADEDLIWPGMRQVLLS